MKKILTGSLICCLMAGMLAGCTAQTEPTATPEPEVHQQPNDVVLTTSLEHLTGDWTGVEALISVHADASVMAPEGIPHVYRVERGTFTQEEADALMSTLLEGSPLIEYPLSSEAEIRSHIAHYEAMARGDIPVDVDSPQGAEALPEYIQMWQEELDELLAAQASPVPISTEFITGDDGVDFIGGAAQLDNGIHRLYIRNGSEYTDVHLLFYREDFGDLMYIHSFPASEDPDYAAKHHNLSDDTKAKAETEAEALVQRLGLEDFVCSSVIPVFFDNHHSITSVSSAAEPQFTPGYELEFTRVYDGIPLSNGGFDGYSTPEDATWSGYWAYESFKVYMDESGLVGVYWVNPYKGIAPVENETAFLPFSQIAEIFSKMIMVVHDDLPERNARTPQPTQMNINVDSVELRYARVTEKGNIQEGMLVPVWDFIGTTEYYKNGQLDSSERSVVLTLSALTGNVIDREMGF